MSSELHQWHAEVLGSRVVSALEKNRFKAEYVATKAEAKEKILEQIHEKATVGFGGSASIKELGIKEALLEKGNIVYDHADAKNPEESGRLARLEMGADIFLTSTNALTMDGQLINTDGRGNRVAAMIFGPGKVILLAGINKLVENIEDGILRIEQIAGPINNKRLNIKNPCVTTGTCMDCDSPTRICNATSILHKKPSGIDYHIIVVGEALGF